MVTWRRAWRVWSLLSADGVVMSSGCLFGGVGGLSFFCRGAAFFELFFYWRRPVVFVYFFVGSLYDLFYPIYFFFELVGCGDET